MSVEPFIAYDPPDGGQRLRGSHAAACRRVARFLRRCTTARPDRPQELKLTIYEPTGDDAREWLVPTLAAVDRQFGPGERRAWATGVDELYLREWELDPASLLSARQFLTDGEPWPRTAVGPVEVMIGYSFRWLDLRTGDPLPGQEPAQRAMAGQAESCLLLGLGRQSWLLLLARFPFAAPNADFIAYVEQVAPFLPVRLSPGRFRHWVPTSRPSRTGYAVSRIDAGLLDGISG
jgi:hypothetical protein